MPIQVRTYRQRVGLTGTPGYRQQLHDPTGEALAQVGQGVARLAGGVADVARQYQQAQNEADAAAIQDAYRQLAEAELGLLKDPKEGFLVKQGEQAMADADGVVGRYDGVAQKIRAGLKNDRQRQQFEQLLGKQRLGFVSSINHHVVGQHEALKEQKLKGALAAAQSKALAAAERGEYHLVEDAIGDGLGALDLSEQTARWGKDVAEQQRKAFETEVRLGVLGTMLEHGRTTDAREYLATARRYMDEGMLAGSKIEKVITEASAAEAGVQLARQVLGVSAATVVRPWDRETPVQRVDPARAFAELAKIDADPSMPENAKRAAREHIESLVRTSQQVWKATLDDVYDRAVTKLANNGWRLSSLAEEKAFLLSEDVGGGRTWEAIVGRRDQELHRQSGKPPTAAQNAAMVEFLWTLPQRQAEYLDPNNSAKAFMAEWGPRLSVQDLEQAAGIVSRLGMAAGKPDETLPSPIIAQIKAEGGPSGYGLWGAKGPKDDADNQLFLTIYNDLLAKQAELRRQGKQLDDATVKERLAFWGTRGHVPGSGFFSDDKVTRVEHATREDYADKPFLEDIPEDFYETAMERLRAAGQPAEEPFVRYLWNKSRGVPDTQNPRPPDPRPVPPRERIGSKG